LKIVDDQARKGFQRARNATVVQRNTNPGSLNGKMLEGRKDSVPD